MDLTLNVRELPDAAEHAFLSPLRWNKMPHPDPASLGYSVREFAVNGTGRIFADGGPSGEAEYTTRVITISPTDDADFSGVVHLELINPSGKYDFPIYWPDTGEHIMARGDAYIGVTCKACTTDHLRGLDPERYADLGMPHDSLVWDLMGAVAANCRVEGGILPGLRPAERILATGWSQSGTFLRTYLSEYIHQQHSEHLGYDVYDAYLIGVSSGGFGPMGYVDLHRDGEAEWDENLYPIGNAPTHIAMDDARRLILNAPVPVIEYMSEDEALHHLWHRRPDSDAPGDTYRCYQIPGRGHLTGLYPDSDRGIEAGDSEMPVPRHEASRWIIAAAIQHLIAWTDGVAPPRADPIRVTVSPGFERDPDGLDYTGTDCVRDSDGHAFGGVRYLEIDLPITRMSVDPDGPVTMQAWRHEAIDGHRERYGTPEQYRELLRKRAAELVDEGWLLPEHVAQAIAAILAKY